jgi:hypothetical protein
LDAIPSCPLDICIKEYLCNKAAMSFGFGVGDFLAVIELANKIRKDFAGAPDEFKGALDM